MLRLPAILILLACLSACGGPLKLPTIPTPIAMPDVQVQSVDLVDASPDAGRYLLKLTLTNPNDFALPLLDAEYRIKINDQQYIGSTPPNATLPKSGSITLQLPAALPVRGQNYEVSGSIQLDPPGQIKQLSYDAGLPRPRAPFKAQGAVQNLTTSDIPPADAAPPPSVNTPSTTPAATPTATPAPASTPAANPPAP
jgi:hypothetical protein